MCSRIATLLLAGATVLQASGLPAREGDGAKSAAPHKNYDAAKSLTGLWQGTFYANQNGAVSNAYLDITEHADGSLSGQWGNGPNGALKIENGESVTQDVFQWEASSDANEQGRYRVRANLKGKTLQLDITYTWREAGKVQGLTAVSILTKKAKNAFPILTSAKITDKPYGMFCVADFNGDGQLDFAVSDKTKGSESVDVYLSDKGSLVKKASYPVGNYPQHIVAGDFNEDGDVDLIVPVYHGALGIGTMHLLTGNGDGTFKIGPGFSPQVNGKGLHPNRIAVGDLNKDGHLDFVVEMGNDWAINIHWGKGDGTFTPMYTRSNGQNPGNTKICDLNNDSWPDIVSGSQYTSLFVHLSNLGDAYNAPVQYLKGTSRRQPIIVGDLDGDEDIDILCAHNTSPRYVSVMINDGNGVFTEKGKINFPDGTGLSQVTDFDFGGKMDFVLGSGNDVLVVPGNGDGTFKTPVAYDMGHKVGGLQLHDLNHDGRLDLVYIDYDSNKIMMRLNATLPAKGIPEDAVQSKPPGKFQVDYAGLRWDLLRTGWKVEDGKLVSQRHARPGFQYGHWANGRGGLAITGNGDESWTDYEVAFDYKMLPANEEFFHAHIPGDSRGMYVILRAKSVSESWNEPSTHYVFSLMPTGKWRLGTYEDWYMTGSGYSEDRRKGKHEHLTSGTMTRPSEGRLRFRLQGDTISVWKDVNIICRFSHTGNHKGKEIGPILYGGFGVGWRYESMGWISNLEVKSETVSADASRGKRSRRGRRSAGSSLTDATESPDLEHPPATDEPAIETLRRLFKKLSARPSVPERWDGTIRFCTGENHSHHRVLVHGFSDEKPDDRPPTNGRPYASFYYDSASQVRLVVRHVPEQEPYVSDYIVYDENRPLARICYSREAVSYGDFILYEKGVPSLSCRILNDGRAVLVKKLSDD